MFTIRDFEPSEADYAAIAAVDKAVWPDNPLSAAGFRHRDETWDPQYLRRRLVVVDEDGRIMAFAGYGETPWSYQPGKYSVSIDVHPDFERRGIGTALYDHIWEALRGQPQPPELLASFTRDDKPQGMRFLEKRGFLSRMRWIISTLDLKRFDGSAFAGLEERLQAQGIKIVPLPELQAGDPDWQRKIWELDWALTLDEPQPAPPTQRPLEQYVAEEFGDPNFWPEGWFVAVDGEQYVGMSQFNKNDADPETLQTGFTGVVRGYRRRGLATALKVRCIELARRTGAKAIQTGNEEHNVMYQINVKLGFEKLAVSLAYEKRITRGGAE